MRTSKSTIIVVPTITIIIVILLVLAIDPIQKWLSGLSIFWGITISIITFIVTGIWAWLRQKDYIFQGSIDAKSWRDLRIWALILMIVMIFVYLIL